MRNSFFPAIISLLFFCTSCNNEKAGTTGGLSATAQKNLDAFHVVSKAFDTGDISQIDSVVASDFRDHRPYGDVIGPDSLKAMITMMKNSGTMKSEIKKELADDEYVMAWMRWTGTSNVAMEGMPAGPIDMNGVEVVRFKDGKAVEHWAFMPPPPPMNASPATPTSTDKKQ